MLPDGIHFGLQHTLSALNRRLIYFKGPASKPRTIFVRLVSAIALQGFGHLIPVECVHPSVSVLFAVVHGVQDLPHKIPRLGCWLPLNNASIYVHVDSVACSKRGQIPRDEHSISCDFPKAEIAIPVCCCHVVDEIQPFVKLIRGQTTQDRHQTIEVLHPGMPCPEGMLCMLVTLIVDQSPDQRVLFCVGDHASVRELCRLIR